MRDKMDKIKQDEALSRMISRAGAWDRIEQFFESNDRIKPFYEEAREECLRDQCFGSVTIMIVAIEKLLDRVEE